MRQEFNFFVTRKLVGSDIKRVSKINQSFYAKE